MKAAFRALLLGGLLGASGVVYACVGSDPTTPSSPDTDSGTDTDSAIPPGGDSDGGGDSGGGDTGTGAACDGGFICGTACVDTSSDPTNCGRCSHDCGKGKCSKSVCQPVLVSGTPDGGAVITSVTTDQTDDNPKDLAVHVFYAASGAGGGVFQDNVIGGNTVTLSTSTAATRTNVVVNGTSVFWFGQNFGGVNQPVFKGQVGLAASQTGIGTINGSNVESIMYDPTGLAVVGSYQVNSTTFGAFRCIVATSACTQLTAFTATTAGNVANDGTDMFFAGSSMGFISKTTFDGQSVSSYITGEDTPDRLRVDGTFLYWSNRGTKVIKRAAAAGASAGIQVASAPNAADAIAADAVHVYWTDSTTGTVYYAPVTGAGPNTPYVALGAAANPMQLVRDKGFLYYSYNGGIYRIALP